MDQKTERKPVRLSTIKKMYEAGEPIVMLTCYDATFSSVEDEAGVDIKDRKSTRLNSSHDN